MDLRLSVLALKIRLARFLHLGFSVMMLYVAQSIINHYSMAILGIHLGLLVWVFAGISIFYSVVSNTDPADELSKDDIHFFDLNELKAEVNQTGNMIDALKMKRFLISVRDVFKRANLSELPEVFVSTPMQGIPEAQVDAMTFNILHAGIGKDIIKVPYEAVMRDDVSQENMSYILAHELGHGVAEAIHHMSVILPISKTAKFFLRLFIFAGLVNGLVSGSWAMFGTILVLYLFDNLITNLVGRLEEFFADSYAVSLGFGDGGENFFHYMESKGIGTFPTFLELFVNHPTHEKRLANLLSMKNNDQGLIPDVLEKWLYGFLAIGLGYYIFTLTQPGTVLLTMLLYSAVIGSLITLSNSDLLPKTAFYYITRTFNFLAASSATLLAFSMALIPYSFVLGILSILAIVYMEAIFNKNIHFLNVIAGYLEALVFFALALILLQMLGLVSLTFAIPALF